MTVEEALAESGIIAILRGVKPDEILGIAEALYDAGVRVIEVPLNSPEPYESINKLAVEYRGRIICGGGTLLTQAHVEKVCAAGGRIAVAPNTDQAVIRRATSLGMIPFPGFATATEAFSPRRGDTPGPKACPGSHTGRSFRHRLHGLDPRVHHGHDWNAHPPGRVRSAASHLRQPLPCLVPLAAIRRGRHAGPPSNTPQHGASCQVAVAPARGQRSR